jgi:hypothetical protein
MRSELFAPLSSHWLSDEWPQTSGVIIVCSVAYDQSPHLTVLRTDASCCHIERRQYHCIYFMLLKCAAHSVYSINILSDVDCHQ